MGAAKRWVEEHFPSIPPGPIKGMLILAYGAGLDAGMAEAQKLIAEELRRAGLDVRPGSEVAQRR